MARRAPVPLAGPPLRNPFPKIDDLPLAIVIAGAAGGAVASWLMDFFSGVEGMPLTIVPFATSILVVMGTPEAEPAQPRALIGGHLVSTIAGIAVVHFTGPSAYAAAAAVGIAMVAMHLTRSFHPPAGIDPLIVVHNSLSWHFLLVPVAAGAVMLAAFAYIWHKVTRSGQWPLRWW